jgi:hypothetical protein
MALSIRDQIGQRTWLNPVKAQTVLGKHGGIRWSALQHRLQEAGLLVQRGGLAVSADVILPVASKLELGRIDCDPQNG